MGVPGPEEKRFKLTVRVLVVLASLLAFLSIFTTWIDRQALDTDEWVDTSGRLLEDEVISDAIANYAVDELYDNVDVARLLRDRLPEDVKPLAAPAAGGLREFGVTAAKRALQTPRVQATWRDANRATHEQLLAILEERSTAVSTEDGVVTLDLQPIVAQLAERIGVDRDVSERLPPDVARLEIVEADQLDTAQTVTKLVKGLAIFFSIGSLALFALAAYLARGRRWIAVFGYGLGLIAAGVAAVALRGVGESLAVDQLAKSETAKPAAEHAYAIGTDLLSSIATTVIAYGVLFVIAAWLASPAGSARVVRRALAPSFHRRPALSWGIFAGLVLLFLILDPPGSSRELYTTLALIALMGIGIEALERKARNEFPDAEPGEWRVQIGTKIREWGSGGAEKMRSAISEIGDGRNEDDARLERLEKLGDLKQRGILDEEEFAAEKKRVLAGAVEKAGDER